MKGSKEVPEAGGSRSGRKQRLGARSTALGLALLGLVPAVQAQTFTPMFSFDWDVYGAGPQSSLLLRNGLLYGTTSQAGASLSGTVFSLDPATGAANLVYTFTGTYTGGGDADWPSGGLTYHDGYFYGVSMSGGTEGWGAVYRIDATTSAETLLYSFTDPLVNGYNPIGTLVYHNGSLYGATRYGGSIGVGTLYKVDIATGAQTILHNFNGRDGGEPLSSLVYLNGMLYGTTAQGGATSGPNGGHGTVFSYSLATGKERVLHRFGTYGDGAAPMAGLTYVGGKLYGTTFNGGMGGDSSQFPGPGTVFQIDPRTGAETVVHAFDAIDDGALPSAELVYRNGLLYGTTQSGGAFGYGTIFSIDPSTQQETVLYSFTGKADGATPMGGLAWSNGSFYGTTFDGGDNRLGVIYRLTP